MVQQGQAFRLKARRADGDSLAAYRYRVAGRGSARFQVGGFATKAEAQRALQKKLARLGPDGRATTITLAEWVEEYLHTHPGERVTIAKLPWLLGKATAALDSRQNVPPAGPSAATGPDWGLGRYESTAEQLAPAAALAVVRAAPARGDTVLDLGCGTGNAALLAATSGATVTGVDPTPRLLALARERASAEGRQIRFLEGVAEALPLPDASIDVALSVFGVIFAADPALAAAELGRVITDRGKIVLTAWLPGSALSEVASLPQAAVVRALGQEPSPPFPWHESDALARLFEPHGFSIEIEQATLVQRAASLDEYLRDVLDVHPFAVAGRAILEPRGEAAQLRRQTSAILAAANDDPNAFALSSPYVLATARRGGKS